MSDRIERLLAAMTLEEKLGQLTMIDAATPPEGSEALARHIAAGTVGSVLNVYGLDNTAPLQRIAREDTRLRIPLIFGFDVVHGHRTIFPLPIAEAGAFDPELWRRTAAASVEETGRDAITLTFAPMLDVCRDPRWGRIAEGPGDEPWLARAFGEAKVRGFQGHDLAAREAIAATAKHLGAYGAGAAGRDYAPVDVSERLLAEVYWPPFEAAVKAGVAAIMPSFNDLAGVPMTANGAILNDLVRGRWGFDGVMVSDYNAVAELMAHGVAGDIAEAAALALNAGLDIAMQDYAYVKGLPGALERGLVTMAAIDRSVRRVLALKEKLGLLDDPDRRTAVAAITPAQQNDLTELSRESGRRSIVLLKNDNGVLPLARKAQRIAMIGPFADSPLQMFGCWFAAAPLHAVTMLAGLRAALPEADIHTASGVTITDDEMSGIAEAIEMAREADVVLLTLGELKEMTGEATSRGRLVLPGRQRELAESILALGKPTVAILSHGRPLTLPWLFERADAVLATWFLGSQAGHAIADVLTGAHNPSARLSVTWPYDVGQIPIVHSQRPSGRPAAPDVHYCTRHTDLPIKPQFPFGFGLSYTRFALRRLKATPEVFGAGDSLTVTAEIANEGEHAGEDRVFLFLRDPVASVARPMLELKGVAKAALAPGERTIVSFTLKPEDFVFPGPDLKPRVEPGAFEIMVGPCADRDLLSLVTVRLATIP